MHYWNTALKFSLLLIYRRLRFLDFQVVQVLNLEIKLKNVKILRLKKSIFFILYNKFKNIYRKKIKKIDFNVKIISFQPSVIGTANISRSCFSGER